MTAVESTPESAAITVRNPAKGDGAESAYAAGDRRIGDRQSGGMTCQ